jgi:hypothetical protein
VWRARRHQDPGSRSGTPCGARQGAGLQPRRRLDIAELNEYFGWYEPDKSLLEGLLTNSRPGKPVVIRETGGNALAGHHGPPTELFTEETQAEIHRVQLKILVRGGYVRLLAAG